MKHALEISRLLYVTFVSLGLSATMISCSGGSSSQPAPVAPQPPAIVAPLSTMTNKIEECPGPYLIQNHWVSRSLNNRAGGKIKIFRFEADHVVESSSDGEVIYDGAVHEVPSVQGTRVAYVGVCDRGRLKVTFWTGSDGESVVSNSTLGLRGDSLVLRRNFSHDTSRDAKNFDRPIREFEVYVRARLPRRMH